jgi:spermidine/putrescine transport system ATP-binding protein
MADTIAVMQGGRIEQLGTPNELYERPTTAFVAGFLGVSNLLRGTIAQPTTVRLDGGGEVTVPPEALVGRSGEVSVGIRPEKIRLGRDDANVFSGRVREVAYVGVSTQYIVETAAGALTVYVQNTQPGAAAIAPGSGLELSFAPEAAFVVDGKPPEEGSHD